MAKKHSIKSRAAFHKKRSMDSHASEGKRFYSRQWLLGYNSRNPKLNLDSAIMERDYMREIGLFNRDQSIYYAGYINGCKARIHSD